MDKKKFIEKWKPNKGVLSYKIGDSVLFTEDLDQLINAAVEECDKKFVEYLTTKLKYAINEQKGLNDDSSAKCYLQGIESAIISIDEEFNFGINEKMCSAIRDKE